MNCSIWVYRVAGHRRGVDERCRKINPCHGQSTTEVGLHKYAHRGVLMITRQQSGRRANPCLESERPHAGACTNASLGNGSGTCVSDRVDSVLRTDMEAPDVVQPRIGCFANNRTEPRNGASRGENGLDHVPDHPLVHRSDTQGVCQEDWGFDTSKLIDQGQSCRRSRAIEGPRGSLDRVVVPVITRGQYRRHTSSNRPMPNP